MNKINIPFRGMTNVPDDNYSQDGSMSVLLNMRHKGGELVQCQPPTREPAEQVQQVMYHAQSGCWIELRNDGVLYPIKDGHELSYSVSDPDKEVISFAIMGNIVVMYLENSVEYAIWKNEGYVFLGPLPKAPRLHIIASSNLETVSTTEKYEKRYSADTKDSFNLFAKKGFLDQCLDAIYDKGGFVDRAQFRVALKLFDGSYVSYSPIYCVGDTNDSTGLLGVGDDNFEWEATSSTGTTSQYKASIRYFKPKLQSNFNFEEWEDIIVGVCLFSSGSLPLHKADKVYNSREDYNYEDYVVLDENEKADSMIKDIVFYKVAEYGLASGSVLAWEGVYLDENTSPSNLATKDVLPDYSTAKQILPDKTAVINSRLLAIAPEYILGKGYAYVPSFGTQDVYEFYTKSVAVTHINTASGIKKVIQEEPNSLYRIYNNSISALLTYPDARATKIELYMLVDGLLLYNVFELRKHPTYNMAYWLYDQYAIPETNVSVRNSYASPTMLDKEKVLNTFGNTPQVIRVYATIDNPGDTVAVWKYSLNGYLYDFPDGLVSFSILPTSGDEFYIYITKTYCRDSYPLDYFEAAMSPQSKFHDAIVTWSGNKVTEFRLSVKADDKESALNVLKASATDNPFYFPTAQTYKFDGDVIDVASNAEAISTGQFGAYPLYVFTKNGIWAMAADTSGQGAYTSQTPFSREICSGAVCPVSGGIVFTTEKGVMAISGGQVTELSAQLDGVNVGYMEYQEGFWENIFDKAGFVSYIEPEKIRNYIKNAKLAYNYLYDEVILSNGNSEYSYVYSLKNKTWSVITEVFDVTTNSYPKLVVYNNDSANPSRLTFDDGYNRNSIVAITRPVKVDTLDFKRLRQAALRCTFEGSLNFYVLGSNDGARFVCITGKECPTKSEVDSGITSVYTRRDLITSMSRSKQYKYIAIAVAGNMTGRISLAEMLVEGGFASNQLR